MRLPVRILGFAGILFLQFGCGSAVSLYEYYIPNGSPSSGLVAEGDTFTLNGKDITIFSGSFHYFRVHPDYWRDTLKKLRAAGLNAVQTYVSWNLHEPRINEFDFGDLNEDMSAFLNLRSFLQMAQEEDLFVILRPGPYITSEWEFGGLPSWLMRDDTMQVRTSYAGYIQPVQVYFNALFQYLAGTQFVDGGPIIAMQIENEYGSFGYENEPRDRVYMTMLKTFIEDNGFTETLLFTSDNPTVHFDMGAIPGVLQMANFNSDPDGNIAAMKTLQPNRPIMAAEFWTGWFDEWLQDYHSGWWYEEFASMYEYVITQNVSVNLYMFIGGTNFGFMNGANLWYGPEYTSIVTSYDYDAPLTEAGDYTDKYWSIQEILSRLNPLQGIVDNPPLPAQRTKAAYGSFPIAYYLALPALAAQVETKVETNTGPINMEALPINGMNGQSYGYILYTTTLPLQPDSSLLIRGRVRDLAQVMVDETLVTVPLGNGVSPDSFGFWEGRDKSITIQGDGSESQIDILVENLGRIDSGYPFNYIQKKGLWEGPVYVNLNEITTWTITPLEFKTTFVNGLSGWTTFTGPLAIPAAYRVTVTLDSAPEDSFLDMRAWNKGVVFMNGFNLGRYWSQGPTQTLYVPAPLMNIGDNTVVVFEQYGAANEIIFIDYPILGQ